jgi:hypothetical protein
VVKDAAVEAPYLGGGTDIDAPRVGKRMGRRHRDWRRVVAICPK